MPLATEFLDAAETTAAASPKKSASSFLDEPDLKFKDLSSGEKLKLNPDAGKLPSGEQSTTYGGPRKPVASLAETMVDPAEEMTTPRVTTPKFTINKDDHWATAVGKEAVNIASSIPEFFSSNLGVAATAAGAAAPVATAGAFTVDMLKSLGEQVHGTYKNWGQMSKAQKAAALTDIGGTGIMAALTGTHAVRGTLNEIVPARKVATMLDKAELTPREQPVSPMVQPGAPSPAPQMVTSKDLTPQQEIESKLAPTPAVAPKADAFLDQPESKATEKPAPKSAESIPESVKGGAESDLSPAGQARSRANNSIRSMAEDNGVQFVEGDTPQTILAKIKAKASTKPAEPTPAPAADPEVKFTQGQRVKAGKIEGTLVIYDDGRTAIRNKSGEFPVPVNKIESSPSDAPVAPSPETAATGVKPVDEPLPVTQQSLTSDIKQLHRRIDLAKEEQKQLIPAGTRTKLNVAQKRKWGELQSTIESSLSSIKALEVQRQSIRTEPTAPPSVEKVAGEKGKGAEPTSAAPATKIEGMGGAVPSEFEPGQGRPSSNKNAVVDRERTERGLPAMTPVLRREWGTAWDEAMAKIDSDPAWQDRLIAELTTKPRPTTDTENAALLQRRVDLRNEYDKATRDASQAYADGQTEVLDAARFRVGAWSDKLAELEQATGKGGAGTALGRGLAARRMMMNEDFSLAKLEMDKRADNGWRPLTEKERADLQKIAADYETANKALETRLATREAEISRLNAEAQLRQAKLEAAQQPKYAPRVLQVAENFAQFMDKRGQAAASRLRERLKSLGAGVDPLILADVTEIAAARITRGAVDFAKWSDGMVKEYGPKIADYLKDAWDKAKVTVNSELDKLEKQHGSTGKAARKKLSEMDTEEQISDVTIKIGKRIKDGQGKDIAPLVQKLARIFVSEGTKDLPTLVKQMHAAILPFASELTERDVMDAFSGYGRYKLLTKGEIDVQLRDLKGQGQQIAKLEDMAEGKAPLRTGIQRRLPSDVERELIRAVNEAKAKGNYKVTSPDTQLRSRLQQWKTTVEHRIADLEKKIANKDYSTRKPLAELKLDEPGIALQGRLEHIRKSWQEARRADQLANRAGWQKVADRFVRWERAFKLSSPVVFGKLTAAAMTRMVTTAVEEPVGWVASKILPRLASQAPREGGMNVRAMAKAAAAAFNKGMNDAWQTGRHGAAEIDMVYGEKIVDKDWANVFGQLHGMMKAPIKRAEFTLSLEKRMEHAIAHGVDVTDPTVQMRLSVEALNDGYRSIFMSRGFMSDTFNQMVGMMEKSKRFPVQGELSARLARFFFPVVRVPLNIVSETMTGVYGVPMASARYMFHAINGTLDTLPPEVADSIMRQFKKGSVGAGLLAIGYLNADNIGGYNWREKRKSGDVKAGQFRIGGVTVPKWTTHAPWFELMSFGATLHRTMDAHVGRTGETKGFGEGAWMAGLGLLEETPFLDQMMRMGEALREPNARNAFLGELAKSTAVPQAVSWAAAQTDKATPFSPTEDARKRDPKTIMQHVETGIPGLRQDVPEKKVKTTNPFSRMLRP